MHQCGSSRREVRTRCGEQRKDIENKVLTKAVLIHFDNTGSNIRDLIMVSFMRIYSHDPAVRLHYDHDTINRHNLVQDTERSKYTAEVALFRFKFLVFVTVTSTVFIVFKVFNSVYLYQLMKLYRTPPLHYNV